MKRNYPDAGEVKEVLASSITPANSRSFLRAHGVVVTSANREFIATLGSMFFWSLKDVDELGEYTDREYNSQKTSRLYIEGGTDDPSSIVDALQNMQIGYVDAKSKLEIKDVKQQNGQSVVAQVSYEKTKPGRIDFLKRQEKEAVICVQPVPNQPGLYVVDFVANDESDYRHVKAVITGVQERQLLKTGADGAPPAVKEITLKDLTLANKIRLFDDFFTAKFTEWTREEIRGLKVKKPDPSDLGDDEEMEVGDSDLKGINSAILHGTGLRNNRIVANFLKSHYYFTGATMRLRHKHDSITMDLEINFKGRDEIGELRIDNTREETILPESGKPDEQRFVMSSQDQWRHSQHFQGVLFTLYRQLLAEQHSKGIA